MRLSAPPFERGSVMKIVRFPTFGLYVGIDYSERLYGVTS